MSLTAAGIIAQIVQSSHTVKEALELCCEFSALGCQALPMQLVKKNEYYKLQLTPDPLWLQQSAEVVKQTADAVSVFAIREFQALTRHKHKPLAFYTIFEEPEKAGEYERILQCPVKFGQEENAYLLGYTDATSFSRSFKRWTGKKPGEYRSTGVLKASEILNR